MGFATIYRCFSSLRGEMAAFIWFCDGCSSEGGKYDAGNLPYLLTKFVIRDAWFEDNVKKGKISH